MPAMSQMTVETKFGMIASSIRESGNLPEAMRRRTEHILGAHWAAAASWFSQPVPTGKEVRDGLVRVRRDLE